MKKIKYFNVLQSKCGYTYKSTLINSLYECFLHFEYFEKRGWKTLYRVRVIYKPKMRLFFRYINGLYRNIILKLSPCIRYR